MGTHQQLAPHLSLQGVPGASSCAVVTGLCTVCCPLPSKCSAAGQAHPNNKAPPPHLLCRGARIAAVLLSGEPLFRGGGGGSCFLLRPAVSSLSELLSGGGLAWRVRRSLYSRQRLANRFCKSRAQPAGSLRDDEMRAECCHGCGVPLNTCLPAPGSGGGGAPSPLPPGCWGSKDGQTGQPPDAGKCFWTETMAFGKGE